MAQTSVGLYCATCQRQTMHVDSTRVNHILHFLLGVLTCSTWWVVWLFLVMGHEPQYACSQCGTAYIAPRTDVLQPARTPEEIAVLKERARKTNQTTAIVVAALALVVLAGTGAIDAIMSWAKRAGGAPIQAETARDKNLRLFVHRDGGDNGERGLALRQALTGGGMPCGGIEQIRTEAQGVWTVNCTDGPRYVLRYAIDGVLLERTTLAAYTSTPIPRARPRVLARRRATAAPTEVGPDPKDTVFVTESNAAAIYHRRHDCNVIRTYPGHVRYISLASAVEQGFTPHACSP